MKNISILLSVIAVTLLLIAIHISQPKLIQKLTGLISKLNTNKCLVILTAIMAIAYIALTFYTHQANSRSEKIFFGQNKPLIDVTPIGVQQSGSQTMTIFSIANYSGFKAVNIGLDLKYQGDWILEWRKARDEKKKKGDLKGVVENTLYLSRPKIQVSELGAGETTQTYFKGEKQGHSIGITGSFNLESIQDLEGVPVLVRVTWENEHGHIFDEIHEYALIRTTDTKDSKDLGGRAFTFIPKGIVNKKD